MDPKRQLRKQMQSILQSISVASLQSQSQAISNRLFQLPIYQKAESVSIYLNMPTGEVQTTQIVEHLFQAGKRCYVPVCDGQRMMMVRLTSLDDYRGLPLNRWKIPEPSLIDQKNNTRNQALFDVDDGLDLIITPGVCFSMDGSRLGHGKGYYDRFFQREQDWAIQFRRPQAYRVALSLREQILPVGSIPMAQTDVFVDAILTPDNLYTT